MLYLEDDGLQRGVLVSEDPSISLIPDLPRRQENKGGQSFAVVSTPAGHLMPPLLEGESRPSVLVKSETQPSLQERPNPSGETAMEEEVIDRLGRRFAKRTKTTILPSSTGKTVRQCKHKVNY